MRLLWSNWLGAFGGFRLPLISVIIVLLEPIVLLIDPLGFSSAADDVSGRIIARVAAPFYGYAADDPTGVSPATRDIVVVLIDDDTVAQRETYWPLPYEDQADIYKKILRYAPAFVFADIIYTYDRGGLEAMMTDVKSFAERRTTLASIDPNRPGLILGTIGEAVSWSNSETLDFVRASFDTALVSSAQADNVYPLYGRMKGDAETSALHPTAAVAMLEAACLIDAQRATPRNYRGCAPGHLSRIQDAANPDSTEKSTLRISWGSLSPRYWEPLPDYDMSDPAQVAELREKARGCRFFEPTFTGRATEALRQLGWSFLPQLSDEARTNCPYALTVPATYLDANNPEMRAYLKEVFRDKFVIIGQSVVGALDRVEILDSEGPGVFTHAMALDNLLTQGADFARPPVEFDTVFGYSSVAGLPLSTIGLSSSSVLELLILMTLALILYNTREQVAERFARTIPLRGVRAVVSVLYWFGVTAAVAFIFITLASVIFEWPAPNWLAIILYAFISDDLVKRWRRRGAAAGQAA